MKTLDNPFAQYLLRRQRYGLLTMRVTLIFGLLITLIGTAIILTIGVSATDDWERNHYDEWFTVAYIVYWAGSLALPLVAAESVARHTARYFAQQDLFELLRLTNLTDAAIAGAFFRLGFHRLRIFLVGNAVLGILTGFAMTVNIAWEDTTEWGYSNLSAYYPQEQLGLTGYVYTLLTFLSLNAALWGLNFVGMGFGIFFGLWWRKMMPALLTAVGGMCAFMLCACWIAYAGAAIVDSAIDFQTPAVTEAAYYMLTSVILCLLPVEIAALIAFRIARYGLARPVS